MGDLGRASGTMGRTGIVTPDAVGLDLEVATLGSRGAAYLLDLGIFLSVLLLLGISQAMLGGAGFVPGWLGIAVLLLFAFAWQFGYPIGFEVLGRGRTPGKSAMGLRVVTVEGAPVGLRHAVVRATVAVLELLGSFGAIAILTSFASPRSQRLGDMAAGTLVVRERRGGGSPSVEVFTAPAGYEAYTAQLDVSGLRARDYAAVRETLRRARELPPQVRMEVTSGLAAQLVDRVRPAPPGHCPPETFLACVAAAVQARRARLPAPSAGRAPGPAPGPAPATGRVSSPDPGSGPAASAPSVAQERATPPSEPVRRPAAGAGDGGFAPPE